jgi:hypothetical protein
MPVGLCRASVSGTQTLGFFQNGCQGITGRHLVSLKHDLGFLLARCCAKLFQALIAQPLAAMGEFDPTVIRLDADHDALGLCAGRERAGQKQMGGQNLGT